MPPRSTTTSPSDPRQPHPLGSAHLPAAPAAHGPGRRADPRGLRPDRLGKQGFRLPTPQLYTKRVGQNVADLAFLDDEGRSIPSLRLRFRRAESSHQHIGGLTLGDRIETTLGFGDSGGPAFVWQDGQYQLAASTPSSLVSPLPRGSALFVPPAAGSCSSLSAMDRGKNSLDWNINVLSLNVQGDPAYIRPATASPLTWTWPTSPSASTASRPSSPSAPPISAPPPAMSPWPPVGRVERADLQPLQHRRRPRRGRRRRSSNRRRNPADATTAVLSLLATAEGTTAGLSPGPHPRSRPRGDHLLSDEFSQTILPVKVASQDIVIDGTPPAVESSRPPARAAACPGPGAWQGPVEIEVNTSDNLSGCARPRPSALPPPAAARTGHCGTPPAAPSCTTGQ